MVRDYSQEYYLELCAQIREINRTEFFFITDGIEDLWNTFSSWIGWLNIEDYVDNIEKYHKTVLDQHNTTEEKLKKIFENVRKIDMEYASVFNSTFLSLSEYTNAINEMCELIDPQKYAFDLTAIQERSHQLISNIREARIELKSNYNDMLTEMGLRIMGEAAVEFLVDIAGSAILLAKFMTQMATNPIVGVATGWEFINSVFMIGEDLFAIAGVPVTFLVTMITGDSESRLEGILYSEDMKDAKRIADGMELDNGMPENVIQFVKILDSAADTVALFNSGYEFVDGIDGVKKTGEITGYVKEVKDDTTLFKNIKNVYKYATAIKEGELLEEVFGETEIASFIKDTVETVDDICELMEPWFKKALA